MIKTKKLFGNKYEKRLLSLANKLDQIPPERFNFRVWVGDNWQGAEDLSCGTTACAIGWASTMPKFRRLGLRLVRDHFGIVPKLTSGKDVQTIFGLNYDEFRVLFIPKELNGCDCETCAARLLTTATAHEVAEHIRKFVKEKTTPYTEMTANLTCMTIQRY